VAADRERSRASWGRAEVLHSLFIVLSIALILLAFSPLGLG
jgi:hypothetical protein